jgi:hypothetical protein
MSAHTPGPWTAGQPTKQRADATITAHSRRVAFVISQDQPDADAAANARLIAAAPDLYAALQAFLALDEFAYAEKASPAMWEAHTVARAALAKVKP